MSNKYLEKAALSRLVKEVARGSVSTTPFELFQKGFIRSPRRYAEGARLANDKIRDQLGVKINSVSPKKVTFAQMATEQSGGYGTLPMMSGKHQVTFDKSSENPFRTPTDIGATKGEYSRHMREMSHQMGISHELFEADAIKKSIRTIAQARPKVARDRVNMIGGYLQSEGYPSRVVKSVTRGMSVLAAPRLNALIQSNAGANVGGHHSLSVLGRESNLIRANPYLQKSFLAKLRRNPSTVPSPEVGTGEADYLYKLTGKRYGSDKFTGSDLRRLHNAAPSRVEPDYDVHIVD